MRKLNYRVVFPFELKLRNTSDDCSSLDDCYDLFAVVVHVGQGPNHGELSTTQRYCMSCWHAQDSSLLQLTNVSGSQLNPSAHVDVCGLSKGIASR